MHVALVSMWTPDTRDGRATRRLRRTAERLAARGHEVDVPCARWWGESVDAFERAGVTYHAVTDAPGARGFASRLPFVLRRLRPDVVHVANTPPAQVRAASVAGTVLRTPVVVDWWCDDPSIPRAAYDRAAGAGDLVVVPSRHVATRVREHGRDADAIREIPGCVDLDAVRAAPVDRRADVVYARDLDADANVESLLLALAELRDRDWRAAVVGDGPERATVERAAADLRIDDRVAFLGATPREERVALARGAHVFAQTATREPFATELLWALAAGCVGVVEYQADSAAHELVEGTDRGALVTDPQELAAAIEDAGDAERLEFDDSWASYDIDAVVDRWVDCYEDAVDSYGLL